MRSRALVVALAMIGAMLAVVPAQSKEFPPQVARGITLPAGFASRVFAQMPDGYLPTSLAWGESTGGALVGAASEDAALHGVRLYVTGFGAAGGAVIAFEDEGLTGKVVASGLDQPLGVVFGPNQTLYVSETANARGRVTALTDTNSDGVFETKRTVLKNLPNGRHQTNGLAFGPDGALYVANGNATDNGLDCGPALVPGGDITCADPERQPWSGAILRVNPDWVDVDLLADIRIDDDASPAADGMDDDSVLVARGFRNIFDLDFDPRRPSVAWTPNNGPDNPSGSDALFAIDTANEGVTTDENGEQVAVPVIEDAGFPSCLHDPHENKFPMPQIDSHDHPGVEEPQENPNPRVIEAFGRCRPADVERPKWVFAEGHEGTAGIAFTRGTNFPERYAGDAFVAEWGSLWNLNGATVTGHKLIHVDITADGRVAREREFMTGVLPIDVTFGPNGHMFVADMSGQIHDVWHVTDAATPGEVTIDMVNGQFVPQVLAVVRGTRVTWKNTDTAAHNVRAVQKVKLVDPLGAEPALQSGSELNSPGNLASGESHSYTFDRETAVYHYNSTVTGVESTTMRGTVIVLPVER